MKIALEMLFLLPFILSIIASTQSYEFEYNDNHFYTSCKNQDVNSLSSKFCEPFFEYFKLLLKPLPTINECKACNTIVNDLKKEGHVKEVVQNFIDTTSSRFCDSFKGNEKIHCKIWLMSYSENIRLKTIKQIEDGTMCHNLLKCKIEIEDLKYNNKDNNYPFCDICHKGIKNIEKFYLKKLSYKELIETLDNNICKNTPIETYTKCKNLTRNIVDKIMKVVIKFKNSTRLCSDIDLCPENPSYPNNNIWSSFLQEQTSPKGICEACNKITENQFQELANAISVDKWRNIGYSIFCDKLSEKKSCESFVDSGLALIISHIHQMMNKEAVCHKLLHCPQEPKAYSLPLRFSYVQENFLNKTNSSNCITCEIISVILTNTLNNSDLINGAEFLYTYYVCQEQSLSWTECIKSMKRDIPRVIQYISHQIKNGTLCKKVCNRPKKLMVKTWETDLQEKCSFCTSVIYSLKMSITTQYGNENLVDLQINKVCNKIRPSVRERCLSLVSKYRKTIKTLLMLDINLVEICKAINQCVKRVFPPNMDSIKSSIRSWNLFNNELVNNYKNVPNSFIFHNIENPMKKEENLSNCEFCKKYINQLKVIQQQHIEDPAFWYAIVDELCFLAKIDLMKCQTEIEPAFENVIRMIEEGKSTDSICIAQNQCRTLDISAIIWRRL